MPHIVALCIFAALSAATWYTSIALYKSTYTTGPDPTIDPNYTTTAACAIGAVTLTCFVPFPLGYLAGLLVWAVAVYGFIALPPGRATVLAGYLAVASAVSRLVVLGVLSGL